MLCGGALSVYKPSSAIQLSTSSWLTPEEKRWPSCHSPVPASSASNSPLSPRPELEEVQNGMTVLPVKSLASTKPSTGQAAMPHQMGYPMNTVSYWSQLSTVSATSSTSRRDSSACSWDTRLLSSVQFRSSSV